MKPNVQAMVSVSLREIWPCVCAMMGLLERLVRILTNVERTCTRVPLTQTAQIPRVPTPAPAGKATQEMEQCAQESARVLTWRSVQAMASVSLWETRQCAHATMGLLERHVKTLTNVERTCTRVPLTLTAQTPRVPTPAPAGKATQEMAETVPDFAQRWMLHVALEMASASLREGQRCVPATPGTQEMEKVVIILMNAKGPRTRVTLTQTAQTPRVPTPAPAGKATQEMAETVSDFAQKWMYPGAQSMVSASSRETRLSVPATWASLETEKPARTLTNAKRTRTRVLQMRTAVTL